MNEPDLARAYAAYRAHASPSAAQRDALWAAVSARIDADAGDVEVATHAPAHSWMRTLVAAAILVAIAAALVILLADQRGAVANRIDARDPHSAEFGSMGTGDGPQPSSVREDPLPVARTRMEPTPLDAVVEAAPLEWIAPVESAPPVLAPTRAPIPSRPRAPTEETERVAPPMPKAPPITEEAQLLQAARGALARREPDRALARVREHARRFADGALAPERRVLEIRAWCQLEEPEEARRVAEAFAAELPRSWAARVHRPCEAERP
jgi:hypothetical protein